MESFFLINKIQDTIGDFVSDIPQIIKYQNQDLISLIWKLDFNEDIFWEVFESEYERDSYFMYLRNIFEYEYPKYKLKVKYEKIPILFNDDLVVCINLSLVPTI